MITRRLPVRLEYDEIRLKGMRIATLEAEVEAIEEEKKAVTGDFKSKIDGRRAEISALSRQVNERQEYRQVEVIERKDWVERTVETVRTDTGEVVDSRPMSPSELQRPIPFNSVRTEEEAEAVNG